MSATSNPLNAGPAFASVPESARALARSLCIRNIAAHVVPDGEGSLVERERDDEAAAVHRAMGEGARVTLFDENTGGGFWVSYSVHCDAPSGLSLLCVASCDGCSVYTLREGDDGANPARAYSDDDSNADDDGRQVFSADLYDSGSGELYMLAAVGNLCEAARMLDDESRRIYGDGLEDEQRDALRDGSDAFGMLDDMEARMGFIVDEARALVIDAHCLLDMAPAAMAAQVHEYCLTAEYADHWRALGVSQFSSADDMRHGSAAAAEWCMAFSERWDRYIDAPYMAGTAERAS